MLVNKLFQRVQWVMFSHTTFVTQGQVVFICLPWEKSVLDKIDAAAQYTQKTTN